MYYTYRYKKKDRQINIDDILDNLFLDTEYTEPHEGVNAVYKDLSYPRYRTITVSPSKTLLAMQHRYTNEYKWRIENLTVDITTWLLHHQADITYHTFKIPKATGGFREIKAPDDTLKEYMRHVKNKLEHIGCMPHDSAYAYVKERDCKRAIQRHQEQNSNWFLKLDISKFFNNCTPEFIRKQLKQLYPFTLLDDACYNNFIDALCALACVDNELPQGTPLSPLITNLLMVPIDHQINKLLNSIEDTFFTYTRYADDMLISSITKFDSNEVVNDIKEILADMDTPFQIKDEKTRFGSKAGRNWNLGIMYNKDNKLTIGYKRKRRLKTMLYQFYLGNRDYQYVLELNGELSYLHNIEPAYWYGMLLQMSDKYHFDFKREIKKVLRHEN